MARTTTVKTGQPVVKTGRAVVKAGPVVTRGAGGVKTAPAVRGRAVTTMRVSPRNHAVLSEIAEANGGISLDDALRILIFEWRTWRQIDDLRDDPAAHQAYLAESLALAAVDVVPAE
jgi:hypothetical protein